MTPRYLIPRDGLLVIDPATSAPLPAEGATVQADEIYWIRRFQDGDVSEGAPPRAKRTEPKAKPPGAPASQE